jgi:very-short-patch-repair endonuclease
MNHAETRLWWELRRDRFGVRFRRQHPFKGYILDFACLPIRLAVEVDGSQHADSVRDRRRDAVLRSDGWTIVRVWSWDVFRNTEGVLDAIGAAIEEATIRAAE